MPAQKVRTRKQTTVTYQANSKKTENLSRGMIYRELYLRLQGQPTVTLGNNISSKTLLGDEWACVQEIKIVANGTDVIKTISGKALRWLNFFWYGNQPQITPTLGDGATANPTFDSYLILPFEMPNVRRPFDTAFDSSTVSSLTIEVTWGDSTSINADAAAWTTDPTLEVYSLESFGVNIVPTQWRIYPIQKTITATNSKLRVELTTGVMYKGFYINTTDAGVEQGDILNNVKVVSGTTVYYDLPDNLIREITRKRMGLNRNHSGAAYDDLQIGNNNSFEGNYYIDLTPAGMLTEAIDTLGFSEFHLELDVTVGAGATNLTIIPDELVPVRGNPNR